MNINRREFITYAASGTAFAAALTSPLGRLAVATGNKKEIKAIVFDAFPIFDPRAAFKVIKEQFPERGDELRKAWFAKIFGYTWLRTSGGQYKDFWHVMEDALVFTASSMKLELTPEKRKIIMDSFLKLPAWPDVKPALQQLKEKNIRLAFLSNMTEDMLHSNMKHNEIEEYFEFVLSTDKAQAFKPAPKAYQLGIDAFGLEKEEIAFAAFAGWDAAGAHWFGYPTAWINRLGFHPEQLDALPTTIGSDMNTLLEIIKQSKQGV